MTDNSKSTANGPSWQAVLAALGTVGLLLNIGFYVVRDLNDDISEIEAKVDSHIHMHNGAPSMKEIMDALEEKFNKGE